MRDAEPDATAAVIEVDGVDVAARDADEMRRFKRDLAMPEERPTEGTTFTRVRAVVAFAIFFWSATWILGNASPIASAMYTAALVVALVVMVGLAALIQWLRARRKRTFATHAKLSLGVRGLHVGGGTFEPVSVSLDDIAGFEAGRTISVVLESGARRTLPIALATAAENAEVVARLEHALMEARAAGGYRGRVRIAPESALEQEAEAAAGARAAER